MERRLRLHRGRLRLTPGTIRATVLIETIPAAFEMEEILYELRDHSAGLNAGRWDYMFSLIKKFAARGRTCVLPDRAQVTMTVPFMRAYTELLVSTCHRRGAHAIGGMAAFIPSRRTRRSTRRRWPQVRADKWREAGDGFDGTWVAHPDLVPVALEEFDERARRPAQPARPHARRCRTSPRCSCSTSTPPAARGHRRRRAQQRQRGLRYLSAWLGGSGAVAIYNLMEDVATAEIARPSSGSGCTAARADHRRDGDA